MVNVFQYTKFKVEGSDFTSSVIASLAYNLHTSEMLVQFKHGTQRLYKNVGPLTFTRFTQADSIGQHYNDVFKGNSESFPSETANFDGFQKVEEEPLADWERELLEQDFDDRLEDAEPVEAEVNLNRWSVGDEVYGHALGLLPVGTVIGHGVDGWDLEKQSDGLWLDLETNRVYASAGLVATRKIVKLPNTWTVGQEVSDDDYMNLPVGSEVYAPEEQGGNLIKISDTHWEDNLTQYHANLLFSARELVSVGDGTYGTDESELPEIAADGDLEAAQPLWYNDNVKLYADGSAHFSSLAANEVTLGTISTNHLFDIAFITGEHNGVVRSGTVPVWAADEAQALVKFQSAMTALGYETVRVKSVMHHF